MIQMFVVSKDFTILYCVFLYMITDYHQFQNYIWLTHQSPREPPISLTFIIRCIKDLRNYNRQS